MNATRGADCHPKSIDKNERRMSMNGRWILIMLLMGAGPIPADEPLRGIPRSNERPGMTSAGAVLEAFTDGRFSWRASGPLLAADSQAAVPITKEKAPSRTAAHVLGGLMGFLVTRSSGNL